MTHPAASYDDIPYPNLTYSQTHPDRLGSLAALLGMEPAPADDCRVLEVGCAAGANLMPMAYGLPSSTFTGIDYSPRQIEEGARMVSELGLRNLRLAAIDITDVPDDFGQFDYIIAHGVYSWTPPKVRSSLLQLCRTHLAPMGVAYISYNTYPGWNLLGMVRGMMRFHVRDVQEPLERAAQARSLLRFLTEAVPADRSAYGSYLSHYRESLLEKLSEGDAQGDSLLLHDELEDVNDPFYFYEFAAEAEKHDLQYLVEARFSSVMPTRYPAEVQHKLQQMSGNIIELEQYLDFLNNRTFRQTLLCHREVQVNRAIKPQSLYDFRFTTRARPVSKRPDVDSDQVERFRAKDGAIFSTNHPITKAAMIYLSEAAPVAVSFQELLRQAFHRTALGAGDVDADKHAYLLAANLLRAFGYSDDLLNLRLQTPNLTTTVGERPRASVVARFQAGRGDRVTNLHHERVELHESARIMLALMDGEHSQDDLLEAITAAHSEGAFELPRRKKKRKASVKKLLRREVARNLTFFARAALLEA